MPATRLRLRFLSVCIGVTIAILLFRAYVIQIAHGEQYLARATEQYVRTSAELFDRGSIFFTTRDGERLSAATVRSGYLLAVDPTRVVDPDAVCVALAPYVTIDKEICLARATAPERIHVELASQLDETVADAIRDLALPGVSLYENRWRYYPGESMAARSIGFIGFSDGETAAMRGLYGLERAYDSVLYRDQTAVQVDFFAELFTDLSSEQVATTSYDEAPGDIITTLEPRVSRFLDSVLLGVQEEFQSSLTGAIIMDPSSGEIIAMNAIPSFNPNDRSGATIEQFRNPLVEDVYEFGSTIKALTVAAGLDSGAITPGTTYYDAGFLEVNTETIRNFDGRGRGTVPMQEVLNQSLNTGVSFIVQEMGRDQFTDYFLDFKLGSETGIDLPSEVHGLVNNLNSGRDIEAFTASYGQGIALTPVAATRALASLGNGGVLVTPHLVSAIEYEDGSTQAVRYPAGTQVISAETSETVSRMLSIVVDDALRGGGIPTHSIAAKTGTAQIPNPNGGGYYDDRYLHSFFGYFPAFDPQYIIFMYTVEPQGVRYASETLTEPFMQTARFLINYYAIPPDREPE